MTTLPAVEDPQPMGVVHCVADGGEHPDMPAERIHGHALGHGEGPVLVDEGAERPSTFLMTMTGLPVHPYSMYTGTMAGCSSAARMRASGAAAGGAGARWPGAVT